jgi:hypothetical protein
MKYKCLLKIDEQGIFSSNFSKYLKGWWKGFKSCSLFGHVMQLTKLSVKNGNSFELIDERSL